MAKEFILPTSYSFQKRTIFGDRNLKKRIVVFAPHPDDETLGCGGTIARRFSEGYEVVVVVITDGRYSFSVVLGIDSDPTPEELKEIRRNETIRATKILGVSGGNLLFLDFEDNTLAKREKEVEEKITEIIEKYTPEEVYFTYKKDYNYDHQATSRIVRRSVQRLGLSSAQYQYSIARPGTCGVYGRIRPLIDAVMNIFKKNYVKIDITEFLSLKARALNEFKSEISIISHKQKKPITQDKDHFLKNNETFFLDG
jgi:LmbE family N-acetylglucosaminyl deacetylase